MEGMCGICLRTSSPTIFRQSCRLRGLHDDAPPLSSPLLRQHNDERRERRRQERHDGDDEGKTTATDTASSTAARGTLNILSLSLSPLKLSIDHGSSENDEGLVPRPRLVRRTKKVTKESEWGLRRRRPSTRNAKSREESIRLGNERQFSSRQPPPLLNGPHCGGPFRACNRWETLTAPSKENSPTEWNVASRLADTS